MKLKIFISLIVFLATLNLFSQNSEYSSKLSLEDCYEIAIKNNPEILINKSQKPATDAAITAAFGSFLPSINYNMSYTRQLNSEGAKSINIGGVNIPLSATDPNSYNMSISANYVLFNGFGREANFTKSKLQLEAIGLNNSYTINKIKSDIYYKFVEVIKNQQIINLRRENITLAKKDLEKLNAQFEAGIIPNTMIYTQEAEIGNKELELINAENNYKISKANLINVLGLKSDQNIDFLESSIPNKISDYDIKKYRQEIGSLNNLVKIALEKRLDYQALKLDVKTKESDIDIARSNYYPTVSANGGWNWSNSSFSNFSDKGRSYLGLNLSFPIFDNFSTNYQVENARYQLTQSKIQLYQTEQNLTTGLQTALLNLESAEKQIEITNRTFQASEKSYEAIQERFNAGVATISDYFLGSNLKINSQINTLTAVYNYYAAKQQLNFLIGE